MMGDRGRGEGAYNVGRKIGLVCNGRSGLRGLGLRLRHPCVC